MEAIIPAPVLSETGHSLLLFASKIIILLLLFGGILLIGFFGELFVVRSLLHIGDTILHRIPLVNKIYKAAQDVVKTLFSKEQKSFSQVVLVPFPRSNTKSLAFITKADQPKKSGKYPSSFPERPTRQQVFCCFLTAIGIPST